MALFLSWKGNQNLNEIININMKIKKKKIIHFCLLGIFVTFFVSCMRDFPSPASDIHTSGEHILPGGKVSTNIILGENWSGSRDCADPSWGSAYHVGGEILEEQVENRIQRYGTAHYDNGDSPLAFSFRKQDLEDLTGQFANNPESNDPSTHCGGFRVYFGLAELNDLTSLRILLTAVDRNGNEAVPTSGNPCVLGFNPLDNGPIVSDPQCLDLGRNGSGFDDPKPIFPDFSTREGGHYQFVKWESAKAMTKNFRDYMEADAEGNWSNVDTGYPCKDTDCFNHSTAQDSSRGYWLRSYTYCIEYFHHLLSRKNADGEDAAGIRFYFGVRTEQNENGEYKYSQHVPAICAIDKHHNDICINNVSNPDPFDEIYYIDWVAACPLICPTNNLELLQ